MKLYKTYKNAYEAESDESGVALLLTLGVLSLLLILGMSFMFTARTDRAAAVIHSDLTKARLLADSGLERALAALAYNHRTITYKGNVYPATKPVNSDYLPEDDNPRGIFEKRDDQYIFVSSGSGDTDKLREALIPVLGYDTKKFQYIDQPESYPGASWNHIEDEDGDIIGRLAFLVIDESGKLDPAAVGDGSEDRIGSRTTEINIANANPGNSLDTTPDQYFSWRHILAKNSALSSGEAEGWAKTVFTHSRDDEELGRRDVGQTDTLTEAHARGIQWVGKMKDDANNNLTKQVAANIVDYCDTDSDATSDYGDYEDDEATGKVATYCGVEKVPYINEVEFNLECSPSDIMAEDPDRELTIGVSPELVNIYESQFSLGCELKIHVEFSGLPASATLESNDPGVTPDGTDGAIFLWNNIGSVAGNSYEILTEKKLTYKWDSDSDPTNFNIDQVYAVLCDYDDDGNVVEKLYDVAQPGDSEKPTALTIIEGNLSAEPAVPHAPQYYSISAEAMDPRSNTNPRHWVWTDWDETENHGGAGSLNGPNAAWNPNADSDNPDDREDAGDIDIDPTAGLSTAYIRNKGMQSLWELGAIHRGEPYRTINLTAYNDGSDDPTYGNGDAAILDKTKIGPDQRVGKVNVNSPIPEVWRALLTGIKLGWDYDESSTLSGTNISDINQLIGDILEQNGAGDPAGDGKAFRHRGQVVQAKTLSDGTAGSQDNDREQEEIIGKLANLLTARQNYFRVIVVGQAVRDLGTPPDAVKDEDSVVDYGSGFCRILAEQKIMGIVYRDAFTNRYKIERIEYLED